MTEKHAVHEDESKWKDYSASYPRSLLEHVRFKILIGPDGVVEDSEVSFSIMELDPGCIYPLHSHDAPEIYFVLEGEAKCTWGDNEFIAVPGTAIRTRPGMPHRLEALGDKKFRAVGIWWAPGGKTEVLDCALNLLEDIESI